MRSNDRVWGVKFWRTGDVVDLVELLGPAVFQYLVKIEKARTPAT